jgi:glycerol-3-phosphate dehydrogenase
VSETNQEIIEKLIVESRKLVPSFDSAQVIHSFAGARAKPSTGDWIIKESDVTKGFVNVAGIDSPGLAGSPAIALHVVDLLRGSGLALAPNNDFNPKRNPIIRPKNNWSGGLSLKNKDPNKKVICKCELVTETEIVDAIHRSINVCDTQAIRKRTRAGMGHCQGTYCEEFVREILARELKQPVEVIQGRPWPETSVLPRRWLTDEEKAHLGTL